MYPDIPYECTPASREDTNLWGINLTTYPELINNYSGRLLCFSLF